MSDFRVTRFNYLPTVIKNLLIINGIVFLAANVWPGLSDSLALYYPSMAQFRPYQLITHLFTHQEFLHIFFNMFALWMFGTALENVWGPKRFLVFYMICGLGAAAILTAVHAFQLYEIAGTIHPHLTIQGDTIAGNYSADQLQRMGALVAPTIGASGAIFGVLVAFGMLFPNTMLYVYFLFPIKAKYFVIIYCALELYLGFLNEPGDNIAHFAHLGGALFGFVMVKVWNRKKTNFY